MTRKPLVSVGLPVYNGQLYIEQAIESLLTQSLNDFELIISDNASTDQTESICRNFAMQDSRIRYFRNTQNIGAAPNYNLTFSYARGKYFKWSAADDLCAPQMLERCVQEIERNQSIVLCYPRAWIIDKEGQIISERAIDSHGWSNTNDAPMRFRRLLFGMHQCTPIFGLIRSEVLRDTSRIMSYISSDKNLVLELSLRGGIYEIPEYLFFRRDHPDASTRSNHDLSGNRIVRKLLLWYDTSAADRVRPRPWWRRTIELVKTVNRAPISFSDSMRVWGSILRFAIWNRELLWKEIVPTPWNSHFGKNLIESWKKYSKVG